MALRVADCDAMIAAALAERRSLGVISQRRWYPSNPADKNRHRPRTDRQPPPRAVTVLGWRDEAYYRSDPWRGSWTGEGGGVIVNQAPHQLDLLAWFMGSVSAVQGSWINANHPYIEVDDSAVATVRFANGGLGSIFVSNSQKPGIHAKVAVHGSSGASLGVQTDGGAMFIAGMSGVLEPPYIDLWTIPGQEDMPATWKIEDAQYFSRIDPTWHFFQLQVEDFARRSAKGAGPQSPGRRSEAVKIIEAFIVPRKPKPGQVLEPLRKSSRRRGSISLIRISGSPFSESTSSVIPGGTISSGSFAPLFFSASRAASAIRSDFLLISWIVLNTYSLSWPSNPGEA
jgi:predicted dehydrogenase